MCTRRTLTYFTIAFYYVLLGIEGAVIFPTLWLYLRDRFGAPEYMVGLVMAVFNLSGFFASPLIGRWSDVSSKSKLILAFANLWEIVGNILYMMGLSQWMLVLGRLLAGVGTGAGAAIIASISRATTGRERTGMLSKLLACKEIGILTGPFFILLLNNLCYYIGPFKVDVKSFPGLLMACLWSIHTVFVLLFVTDLRILCDTEEVVPPSIPVMTNRESFAALRINMRRKNYGATGKRSGMTFPPLKKWSNVDTNGPSRSPLPSPSPLLADVSVMPLLEEQPESDEESEADAVDDDNRIMLEDTVVHQQQGSFSISEIDQNFKDEVEHELTNIKCPTSRDLRESVETANDNGLTSKKSFLNANTKRNDEEQTVELVGCERLDTENSVSVDQQTFNERGRQRLFNEDDQGSTESVREEQKRDKVDMSIQDSASPCLEPADGKMKNTVDCVKCDAQKGKKHKTVSFQDLDEEVSNTSGSSDPFLPALHNSLSNCDIEPESPTIARNSNCSHLESGASVCSNSVITASSPDNNNVIENEQGKSKPVSSVDSNNGGHVSRSPSQRPPVSPSKFCKSDRERLLKKRQAFIRTKTRYQSTRELLMRNLSVALYTKSDVEMTCSQKFHYFVAEFLKEEIICLLTVQFMVDFTRMTLEGMLTPLTDQLLGWGEFENSILFSCSGVLLLSSYVLVSYSSRKFQDRTIIVFGLLCLIVTMTWQLITIAPAEPGDSGLLAYLAVAVFFGLLGMPPVATCCVSLLSKVTTLQDQGFRQGIQSSVSNVGQIIGPLWGSGLVTYLYWLYPVSLGLLFLPLGMISLSWKKLRETRLTDEDKVDKTENDGGSDEMTHSEQEEFFRFATTS